MLLLVSLFFISTSADSANRSQKLFRKQNERLFNDLFAGYHREMSPFNGHGLLNDTHPLTAVTLSLQYARLIRVLEPELQHRNLLGLFVDWQDPRLEWNASEYGGIDHIYVNRFSVWMPEIYPCESSQMQIVSPDQSLSIRLNASGFLHTFITYSVFFSCEFDVYRFPFDTQHCYYCFILFNYDHSDELRFRAKMTARPSIYTIESKIRIEDTSEWSLKLHGITHIDSLDNDFNIGLVFYNISITRRPQFWVGLVITPTFVIGSLIIIGLFFGPGPDVSNNAVALGLTTMMSMMMIVGIITNAVPKSSSIPILGWYILAEIIIIIMAVLALVYSEIICKLIASLVKAGLTKSKSETVLSALKGITDRGYESEEGKRAHVWIFLFFFSAHIINIIILFNK